MKPRTSRSFHKLKRIRKGLSLLLGKSRSRMKEQLVEMMKRKKMIESLSVTTKKGGLVDQSLREYTSRFSQSH